VQSAHRQHFNSKGALKRPLSLETAVNIAALIDVYVNVNANVSVTSINLPLIAASRHPVGR